MGAERQKMKPMHFRKMYDRLGSNSQTMADLLGTSTGTITSILREDECTAVFELAAKYWMEMSDSEITRLLLVEVPNDTLEQFAQMLQVFGGDIRAHIH